jgi:phosphatidylinositol dimannoside acyltransferase
MGGSPPMWLSFLNVRKGMLQVLLPALRLLPPRAASRVVATMGRAEYHLNRPLKLRFDAALQRGAQHFGCHWNVPALGSELAANHLRWRARDLLLDGRTNAQVAPLFTIEGREALDSAFAQGKGVILLFNHFGPFLMPAHWLVREGYPLRWFTERPRNISKMIERTFEADGPFGQRRLFMSRAAGPAEGGTAIRRAVRILKTGMIVQIAGDVRGQGARTAPGNFLGRTYTFTTTWITLAALTGSPVVPTFCRMAPDGSYHLEFLPSFHVPRDTPKAGAFATWIQSYLDTIEDRVKRHPANSGDYLFWAESGDYVADHA